MLPPEQLLSHQARLMSFGQDTSRLYERKDSDKKAWRAEFPATEDDKVAAREAAKGFTERWPLNKLSLDDAFNKHTKVLEEKVAAAEPGARPELMKKLNKCYAANPNREIGRAHVRTPVTS